MQAACPEDDLRDGPAAVTDAGRACDLTGWKDIDALTALAAAAAEVGDFEAAIGAASTAAMSPDLKGSPAQKHRAREHLKLYEARQPLRLEAL